MNKFMDNYKSDGKRCKVLSNPWFMLFSDEVWLTSLFEEW
jgi:hypothetical protein